jgi:hypothetical protein
MPSEPPGRVTDAPLFVVPRMLDALRAWRAGPKLADLPPEMPEHARLEAELDRLAQRLLNGIETHPTRFWAMRQIQQSLETVGDEKRVARDCFGRELERVLAVLGIADVDGLIAFYRTKP